LFYRSINNPYSPAFNELNNPDSFIRKNYATFSSLADIYKIVSKDEGGQVELVKKQQGPLQEYLLRQSACFSCPDGRGSCLAILVFFFNGSSSAHLLICSFAHFLTVPSMIPTVHPFLSLLKV